MFRYKVKMPRAVMKVLLSFAAVKLGVTRHDRLRILKNRLRMFLYPIQRVWRRHVDGRLIGEVEEVYRCRFNGLVFSCSGGRTEEQLLEWFEPSVKAEVLSFTRGDFLDVGANIGVYAISAAARLGNRGKVVAIEPHPSVSLLLKRTAKENNLTNIEILQAAAWSSEGEVVLYEHVFGGEPLGHSVVRQVSGSSITVPAVTVDQVVDSEDLDELALVKIDVEGAELEIFRGMRRTLQRFRSLTIIFESLNRENLAACTDLLREYGFSVQRLPDGNYLATGARNSESTENEAYEDDPAASG